MKVEEPARNRSQLPKADLLTLWFSDLDLFLVMAPQGEPFTSVSFGQLRGYKRHVFLPGPNFPNNP